MSVNNTEINRGYVNSIHGIGKHGSFREKRYFFKKLSLTQLVRWLDAITPFLLPLLFSYGLCLILGLVLYKFFKRKGLSQFHRESVQYISDFLSQYPLHLYPIVAKSLELAFLKEHMKRYSSGDKIVELAIGEGTFSKRIFSTNMKVVGLDLNPYSLCKTVALSHVVQRVVCDCLQPPIEPGTFNLLVANNFLHHVSDKRTTLFNWSKIAETAIFNENTPFWASSWAVPYILSSIGLTSWGSRISKRIELFSLQALEREEILDEIVTESYTIKNRESYLDRNTFFLCSIFSFLMIRFGPPTPKPLKKILMGPLKPITMLLTKKVAELLIYFDSQRSRKKDVFISYCCESKNFNANLYSDMFVCPDCSNRLKDSYCMTCRRRYDSKSGMLFLLPKNLQSVCDTYDIDIAETIPPEHL